MNRECEFNTKFSKPKISVRNHMKSVCTHLIYVENKIFQLNYLKNNKYNNICAIKINWIKNFNTTTNTHVCKFFILYF